MSSNSAPPKVVPACLSFLAIYNPSLGESDDTFHNQIVFYYSRAAKARARLRGKNAQADEELREQENEKLRQVGLAQGMVGFARSFATGEAVDSVETEKSRIVLQELEEGWWILASIDLTQLPIHNPTSANKETPSSQPAIEYSSREVSPPALLLQQLVRAYRLFLLHHGPSLEQLYQKSTRDKFTGMLERYWTRFANSWDVLLHGSPAVEIYNGLKLAAGGELGMGVGEEEWGSGERLVLEDFVHKTPGLVDVMVSRFGEPSPQQDQSKSTDPPKKPTDVAALEPWIGSGRGPEPADGIFFSGVGAVARESLRDLSHWTESIYTYGDHAYGVRDNPMATVSRRRRKELKPPKASSESVKPPRTPTPEPPTSSKNLPPGIPPPIVKAVETPLKKASVAANTSNADSKNGSQPLLASMGDSETWVKYLTLGYGTAWGTGKAHERTPTQESVSESQDEPKSALRHVEPEPDVDHVAERLKAQISSENNGYFAIGLKGNMDEVHIDDENDDGDWNNRTVLRTVYVKLEPKAEPATPGSLEYDLAAFEESMRDASKRPGLTRLRPVVYVHRPFIYTFLFKHRTESLNIAGFYRNLHTYFSPLHRSLSNSTSPDKVALRLSAAFHPCTTTSSSSGEADAQPIYDLAYDPRTLTVHSSLPNIPEPGTLLAEGLSSGTPLGGGWSRVEALNVHSQILATVGSTKKDLSEIERTCKTSRGWWVVWMKLPPSQHEEKEDGDSEADKQGFDTDQLREAFLVRRAHDSVEGSTKSSSGRFGSGMWGGASAQKTGGAAAGWGPKGLAEGIGIDARRYVEGLLSLNR